MIYNFLKKSATVKNKSTANQKGTGINSENQQFAEELQKPIIRNLKNANCIFF